MDWQLMDWQPTASLDVLRRRAALLRQVRAFFDARGFWEVETPILSHDTVVDRHLDPIGVWPEANANSAGLDSAGSDSAGPCDVCSPMWLQTSPEFGMKRLLAAGADRIYQITRAFRSAERGRLHNPEFTMLEWYRVGDGYAAAMDLLAEFAAESLAADGVDRVTYADAFQQHAGLDPHRAEPDALMRTARQRIASVPLGLNPQDRDAWLDLLLVELVQPQLGIRRPAILYDYPASQAALAQVRDTVPPVAERFELYVRGIELANGYHELLDAEALHRRAVESNAARAADGKPPLPPDSRLLSAMRHGLPACAGVALGFDRLLMVLLGLETLDEVLAFPWERA